MLSFNYALMIKIFFFLSSGNLNKSFILSFFKEFQLITIGFFMHVNGFLKNNQLMLNFRSENPSVPVNFYRNWITCFFLYILGEVVRLKVTTNKSRKVFYVSKNSLRINAIKSLVVNNSYLTVLRRIRHTAFKILLRASQVKKTGFLSPLFPTVDFEIFKNEMQKRIQNEEETILKLSDKNKPDENSRQVQVNVAAQAIETRDRAVRTNVVSREREVAKSQAGVEDAKSREDSEVNKMKVEAAAAKTQIARLQAEAEAAKTQIARLRAEAETAKTQFTKLQIELEAFKTQNAKLQAESKIGNTPFKDNGPAKGNANKDGVKDPLVNSYKGNGVQFITQTSVLKLAANFQSAAGNANTNKSESVSFIIKSPVKLNKTPEITREGNVKAIGEINEMIIITGLLNNIKGKQKALNISINEKSDQNNNKENVKNEAPSSPSPLTVKDKETPSNSSPLKVKDEDGNEISVEYQLEVVKLIQEQAEEGDEVATYQLGKVHEYGVGGLPVDFQKAVAMYQSSAAKGYVPAKRDLAKIFEEGKGVIQDLKLAFKMYGEAAEDGDAFAQFQLASMFETGSGCVKDIKKALQWYEKAARQGDSVAQYNLGVTYEKGTKVTKDLRKAYKWFGMAAEQGDEDAIEAKKNLEFEFQSARDPLKSESRFGLFTG